MAKKCLAWFLALLLVPSVVGATTWFSCDGDTLCGSSVVSWPSNPSTNPDIGYQSDSPTGNPRVWRITFLPGIGDGAGVGDIWPSNNVPSGVKEIWVQWWWKYSSGFTYEGVSDKQFFIWSNSPGGTAFDVAAMEFWAGEGVNPSQITMLPQGPNGMAYPPNKNLARGAWYRNPGTWHKYTAHYKWNSAGQWDGVYQAWVDGVQISDYSSVYFGNNGEGIGYVDWSITYGGRGKYMPNGPQYLYFAGMYIGSTAPSDLGGISAMSGKSPLPPNIKSIK